MGQFVRLKFIDLSVKTTHGSFWPLNLWRVTLVFTTNSGAAGPVMDRVDMKTALRQNNATSAWNTVVVQLGGAYHADGSWMPLKHELRTHGAGISSGVDGFMIWETIETEPDA